jgi:hypothetical protein
MLTYHHRYRDGQIPLAFDKITHYHGWDPPLVPPDRERKTTTDKSLFVWRVIDWLRPQRIWAVRTRVQEWFVPKHTRRENRLL